MFKPFYWLDIVKTEKRLSDMSMSGKHLKSMNFILGTFEFENGEPCRKTYIIRRSPKCRGNAPKKLISEGWETVCGNKNNYAAVCDGESDTCPSFRGYRRTISIGKIICFFILCFGVGMLSGMAAAFSSRSELPEDNEKYIGSFSEFAEKNASDYIMGGVLIALAAAVGAVLIRSGSKYDKLTGDEYDLKFTIPAGNFTYTKEQEKQMLKNKTMIAKVKPGWFYSPDKGEGYVEQMERDGWNFYRFDKIGVTFYFVKGTPRKVKFVVDYQDDISDEYLSVNREAGWKLQFKSVTKVGGYIMWLKEYDGEEPEFFSDSESMRKRSKQLAVLYGVTFSYVIIAYAALACLMVKNSGFDKSIPVIVMCGMISFEYGLFGMKSISYYFRMREKYKEN